MALPWNDLLPFVRPASAPVYHYTSAAGLLAIVQNNSLRASEATGLNDIAEVTQGWNFIDRWLARQNPNDDSVSVLQDAARAHQRSEPSSSVHVVCASTQRDDANQWRLYADNGRGYCVEFDPTKSFSVITTREARVVDETNSLAVAFASMDDMVSVTPWLPVLYRDDEKEQCLEQLLRLVAPGMASARDERDRAMAAGEPFETPDESAEAWAEARLPVDQAEHDFGTALASIARLSKSDGYSGENEVRMLVTCWIEEPYVGFRAGPYGVVKFATLAHFDDGSADRAVHITDMSRLAGTLPLRSVGVGPLIHFDNNAATVRALIHANGYKLSRDAVWRSRVPLR
ncbi:DUF2971 domain-containing protein [Cellulomonas sp. P5_C6]